MLTARMCESGKDAGKWFSLMTRPGVPELRVGYCARGCAGHASSEEALAHHFQFQLDRETDLWMVRTDDRKCDLRNVHCAAGEVGARHEAFRAVR